MEHYIIIGGVAAGTKTAAKLRRLCPNSKIDLYTEDTHVSYSACGFPYFIGGVFDNEDFLFARTVNEFENSNIHIHLQNKCTEIIPSENKIVVNNSIEDTYDKLMISTGAIPKIPNIKNLKLKKIYTLRTVEDAISIKKAALKFKKAVIIGGGYIGIELLEAFVNRGIDVTLVEASDEILPIFDKNMSKIIKSYILEKSGNTVKIINSDTVVEFCGNEEVEAVKTQSGKEIITDFVVICSGVKPNTELAQKSGITIGETGAIKVNSKMQTNFENIFASGDCTEKYHLVSKKNTWIPLASTAIKEARCAAINMSGNIEHFDGIVGSAVTKYFDYTMAITGLNEIDSIKNGFNPISVTITKSDIVDYMPEAKDITIKVIADKDSKRLLGAQAIGLGNADKRIALLVPALVCQATVKSFMKNDLPYSPAFSTSIDPILTACERLSDKIYN